MRHIVLISVLCLVVLRSVGATVGESQETAAGPQAVRIEVDLLGE